MRVTIATPLYPPEIGGPATYARILRQGLGAYGIEVSVIPFGDVRHLPKLIRHLVYGYRVWRSSRRSGLVLALDPVSVGLPAFLAAKLARRPLVLKVVGDYAWEQGRQRFGVTESLDEFTRNKSHRLPVRFLCFIERSVARRARLIVVPSQYLRNIVREWGINEKRIRVIYNAVQFEHVGTVPSAVRALARPVIMTAGRLVPWKHVDAIIDAVAAVPERTLVVVGDGPERHALETRARERMPGRALFTGTLSHMDVLATMKEVDMFVLNSSYEGLSHLLVEATMLHVPVIATHAGGNAEIIQDGVNGRLIPAGDTDALIEALKTLPPTGVIDRPEFTVDAMLRETAAALSHV
jgi:glycosyltransferase involved in cell wall biosynthesis